MVRQEAALALLAQIGEGEGSAVHVNGGSVVELKEVRQGLEIP